jgi:hypothetical protein
MITEKELKRVLGCDIDVRRFQSDDLSLLAHYKLLT